MSFGNCPRYHQTRRNSGHSQMMYSTWNIIYMYYIYYIQVFILGYFIFHIGCIDISIAMSYIWMWKHQKHSTVFQECLLITEDLGKRWKNQLSSWDMHCRYIFQLSLLWYELLPWHNLEILIWLRKRWNMSSSGITALRQTKWFAYMKHKLVKRLVFKLSV